MILKPETPVEWTHGEAIVNGVRLHYVEAGVGPLVVLLHGFPEFWYSWRHQITALAAAGFRALAPDLRGYNLSDKPLGVSAYRMDVLLEDVADLIRHAGAEKVVLAGHDWGGAIAWYFAMRHAEMVERLIILNAPHPAAFRRELRSWTQLRKSWYMFFLQAPGLPEQLLGLGDYDLIGRVLHRQPVHSEAFTAEDVRRYKHALARPGALTAALNYYRALGNPLRAAERDVVPITAPTLLLWGEQDAYLSPRLTEGLDAWVPNLRIVRFPDVSHWIQNDAPERVNRLMIDFLHDIVVPPTTHGC